jgi:hypothetical protein
MVVWKKRVGRFTVFCTSARGESVRVVVKKLGRFYRLFEVGASGERHHDHGQLLSDITSHAAYPAVYAEAVATASVTFVTRS